MTFHDFDMYLTGFLIAAFLTPARSFFLTFTTTLFGINEKAINKTIKSHVCKNRKRYFRGLVSVICGSLVLAPAMSGIYSGIKQIDIRNVTFFRIDYFFMPASTIFVFCLASFFGPLKERA